MRLFILFILALFVSHACAQTPNFALVGFATQNGGTKGGQGGATVTATNYAQLKSYAESSTTYIIMVQGTMSNGTAGGQINVQSNKSIIGIGSTAFLSGIGIGITNANNVIIQNLKITLVGTSNPYNINGGDCIGIQGTSKNIWIDHCELYSENPNTQTNIDKYDGLLDIKGQTGWITISWCYLHDHHKGGLVGAADNDLNNDRKVTLHHNYYKNVKLRVPMYRGSVGHFFNNYIVSAKDASEIRAGTCVRIEKNYYEALHYSIYTTNDSPGKAERIDNIEVQRTSRAYPANCTANIPYSYSAVLTNNTNDVKTIVPQYSGVGKIGNTVPCTAPTAALSAAGATTFCQGSSVILNANTGNGFTYQWKNGSNIISGSTNASYTASASGPYSVIVTNAATCSATSSTIAVTVNPSPTAVITPPAATIIPYNGTITLNASTGTGYTYQWKKDNVAINGATAASYSANTSGSYTVTATAATCSATSSAIVLTVAPTPKKYIYNYDNSGNLAWNNINSWTPKAVPTAIDTVIIRTGEVQINALTHTAPVYIEPNGVLRLVTANSTVDKIFMQGGTLKVFTSAPELALTSNITVEQPSTIMAGSVAATIFTLNGTITGNANLTKTSVGILRINSTASGFKGNWIITEGKIQLRSATGLGVCGVQVQDGSRLDIEVAGASIYSLVLASTAGVDLDQNLTTTVAVFGSENILTGAFKNTNYPSNIGSTGTLNVSNSLVSLSGPTTFCTGSNLTLTSSSGASYIWKNNTTQVGTAAAYTTNAAGSFIVNATSAIGCKVTSAPVATTLNTAPAATITSPATSFCTGGSVLLTSSTGSSYKWFNGTSQVGTASTYSANVAGAYTVEVTYTGGCKSTSAVTQITAGIAPTPTISSPATSFCTGSSVLLTASTGASYKWFNGTSQVGTASTYTANAAGAYTVEVTYTGGCKATSAVIQITAGATPTPTITSPATSFCTGSSVLLTASTGASYKWFNGTTQVGTNSTYSANAAGAYTVEVTYTGDCKATSAAIQITSGAAPTPTIISQATSFCTGSSVLLTASTGDSYKWFNGTTQVETAATYSANTAGAYTVEVTYTGGCKATSAVIQITSGAAPTPTITSPATSFCTGGSVLLTASTGASYKWFNGTNQVGSDATYAANAAGAYTVEVTYTGGCKATSAVTQINVSSALVWYQDLDNDGKGNASVTTTSCTQPTGYVSVAGDACPTDPNKIATGACGCGNAETDSDGDNTPDCTDSDDDNDGIADANDCAPLNANIGTQIIWYADTDNDGMGDATNTLTACTKPTDYVATSGDTCPTDANKTAAGNCGCGNTESSCFDCAGTANGTAFFDNCNICVGGTTGNTACIYTATINSTHANIKVIPQPFDANTKITIDNLGMIQSYTIISASGSVVETRQGLHTEEIMLGDQLASGLYTVIITTENGMYTTKIVKK